MLSMLRGAIHDMLGKIKHGLSWLWPHDNFIMCSLLSLLKLNFVKPSCAKVSSKLEKC